MPNLSLAELEALSDPKQQQQVPPPPQNTPPPPLPPIKGGDGTPPTPNLELERQKQVKEAEELEKFKLANDGKTPDQLANEQRNIAAGKNPDGSEKTAAQIEADKKAADELAATEEDDLALWDDVDKLWGDPIKVEYKNEAGEDVHPNSPEGIFLREKAIDARGAERFEAYLQSTDPRAYEYILHRQAGGTDEDFFARKTVTLPVYEEFQNSVDLKTRVVSESLRIKGVPESVIKLTIDDAVKSKTLDPLADGAYKEIQKKQQDEIDRLSAKTAQDRAAYDRSVQILDKSLKEEMTTGMKIVIPDAKRAEFDAYVRQHIQEAGGQFFFAEPIDAKNLPALLDAMYFRFSKGNLSDLVQRSGQTQNVNKLRRHTAAAQQQPRSADSPAAGRKLTLGEL